MKSRSDEHRSRGSPSCRSRGAPTDAPGHGAVALFRTRRGRRRRDGSSVSASAVNCSPARCGADRCREQARGDQELLLLADDAGVVDHLLIVARIAEERIDLGDQHRRGADTPSAKAGSISPSIDVGAVDHRVGHARGGGHQLARAGCAAARLRSSANSCTPRRAGGRGNRRSAGRRRSALPVARDGGEQQRQQLGEMARAPRQRGWRDSRHSAICGWWRDHGGVAGIPFCVSVSSVPGSSSLPVNTRFAAFDAERLALGEEIGVVALTTRFERARGTPPRTLADGCSSAAR